MNVDDVVRIPLRNRKGVILQYAIIDCEDEAMVSQYRWSLMPSKGHLYVRALIDGDHRTLHRFLLGLVKGDKRVVDHKDGDALNNRRSNIRLGTYALNAQNRKPRKGSASGLRGVTHSHRHRGWQAQVSIAGINHYLGSYKTPEEAAGVASTFRAVHMPFAVEQ